MRTIQRIALVGNPNSGKTTLFNQLTGLHQKVGNYPGVTVDKKVSKIHIGQQNYQLLDLPGTYSLHPKSMDEEVVLKTLLDRDSEVYPDLVLYVANATELDKQLLLLSQVSDLDIPVVVLVNMADLIALKEEHLQSISNLFDCPVYSLSAHSSKAKNIVHQAIESYESSGNQASFKSCHSLTQDDQLRLQEITGESSLFFNELLLMHHKIVVADDKEESKLLTQFAVDKGYNLVKMQIDDVLERYTRIDPFVHKLNQGLKSYHNFTDRLDRVLSHAILGPMIFIGLLILLFNAVFSFATIPMDFIDATFAQLQNYVEQVIPEGQVASFISDGIIAGLGGVLIFIPQIAILFLFIGLLENIGYMSRAVYLFDGLMRRFGLNGRSIVSLVSSGACAIPAIMGARTIGNWKERLITILVSPFISCQARLPVYVILISLAIPKKQVWGVFNTQGLTLSALYLLSVFAALFSAWVLNRIFKSNRRSTLIIELPDYKLPNFKDILINVYYKVGSFVMEAGKIIIIISMLLWFLASYGPGNSMQKAEEEAVFYAEENNLDKEQTAQLVASQSLEKSYIGRLGIFIEPVLLPLGYDWRIGIAVITSFAAREVFVGTMATIYSVGEDDNEGLLHTLKSAKRPNGLPVFTFATCISLLLFYLFAMQCMSTLAVVKKETNSWKWPILQFVVMSTMAYISGLLAYQLLTVG